MRHITLRLYISYRQYATVVTVYIHGLSRALLPPHLAGVLLKGNGLQVLAPQILALTLFATAVITLAVVKFQRKLE